MAEPWDRIEAETRGAFHGEGNFPLRAYSEYMPSPYVGIKPYAPERAHGAATFGCGDAASLDIDEYEQAHDIEPGKVLFISGEEPERELRRAPVPRRSCRAIRAVIAASMNVSGMG